MERLTKFDFDVYRCKKPKQWIIDKLAEYENIGTVKELRDAKLAQVLLVPELQKENKELKHELEVYKIALKSVCEWIDNSSWSITDGTVEDWERAKQTTNDFYLKEARKELEDER